MKKKFYVKNKKKKKKNFSKKIIKKSSNTYGRNQKKKKKKKKKKFSKNFKKENFKLAQLHFLFKLSQKSFKFWRILYQKKKNLLKKFSNFKILKFFFFEMEKFKKKKF